MDSLERTGDVATPLRAMRLCFFMAGLGISAWAITVPFTKIRFGLDDGTLGLMLLAGGTGGVTAMPFCGPLIARFGSRAVVAGAGLMVGVFLPLLGLAPSPFMFTVLLFIYGLAFGAVDVAMNAQGAAIEAKTGRRHMSSFHAMYSIGSLVVALATSFLLKIGLSNAECALLTTAAILLTLLQTRHLLPKQDDLPSEGRRIALPNRATVILGMCCFACFLTEGAATDWSTIFLRFSRGMNIASAALGYAGFAVAMAASRLAGDRVAMWLGAKLVMQLGCALAVCGIVIAITLPFGLAGIIGFSMVGLGIGNIAPLVFSAASRVEGMTANQSVPTVVGLGYAGFLTGPVVIGLVAHATSLASALGLDAALLGAIFFASRAVA